jgi:phage-related protein
LERHNSKDKNIIVNRLPDDIKPERNVDVIEIPGREGFLTVDYGTYKSKVKTVEATLKNGNVDDVIAWLTGENDVIFSSDTSKKQKAVIINEIQLSRMLTTKFKRFVINFRCQPYKEALENNILTLTAPEVINNPGTSKGNPVIKIYGTGDITLTINGNNIYLYNVVDYITVDSILQDSYKDTVLKNNDMLLGEFPELLPGANAISWAGTVTKVEITPNWRWL